MADKHLSLTRYLQASSAKPALRNTPFPHSFASLVATQQLAAATSSRSHPEALWPTPLPFLSYVHVSAALLRSCSQHFLCQPLSTSLPILHFRPLVQARGRPAASGRVNSQPSNSHSCNDRSRLIASLTGTNPYEVPEQATPPKYLCC